jgi:hypothetical protein
LKRSVFRLNLLILVSILSIGCTRSIVQTNVEEIKPANINESVQNWVREIGDSEGIYIGRVSQTDKHEDYYIYLKNKRLIHYELKNDSYQGISINIDTNDKADLESRIIKISTRNKKAEYIILNGKKIDVANIQIIE